MWNDTKVLFKNRNFLLLCFCFTLMFSVYNCFGNILNYLFDPIGYTPSGSAIIAMGTVFFGVIASMATGVILDRTNRYTLALKLSCIGSAVAFVCGYFLL